MKKIYVNRIEILNKVRFMDMKNLKMKIDKILCFVIYITLSTSIVIKSEYVESEPFDLIVGNEIGEVVKIRSDTPDKPTTIQNKTLFLEQGIAAIVRYQSQDGKEKYYIATESSAWARWFLYECDFDLDHSEFKCDLFFEVKETEHILALDELEWVTRMVVVDDSLFIGHSNVLYYCILSSQRVCKTVKTFPSEVTIIPNEPLRNKISGVDYDSNNRELYVGLAYGEVYRCGLEPSDPSKFVKPCKKIHKPKLPWILRFVFIHVAYDALWVGSSDCSLYKCPLNKDNLDCKSFANLGWLWKHCSTVDYIGSRSDGYIYAAASNEYPLGNRMYKCNPNSIVESCRFEFDLPIKTQSFLILD